MRGRQRGRPPKLCFHKQQGLYYATIGGKPVYFRPPFKAKPRTVPPGIDEQYRAAIAEWFGKAQTQPESVGTDPTVEELACGYLGYAMTYYVKHGRQTPEVLTIRTAVAPARDLFGQLPAREFDQDALKAVRDHFVAAGHPRNHINKQVGRVRRMFRWAVGEKIVAAAVLTELESVRDLPKGRFGIREEVPVEPVDDAVVERTLVLLDGGVKAPKAEGRAGRKLLRATPPRPEVAAMIRVQRLIGCRPSEVCIMRPGDIDVDADRDQDGADRCWAYVPSEHKTEHHEESGPRIYWIGPRAQTVLQPFLDAAPTPDAWVFPLIRHARTGEPRGRYNRDVYRKAIQKSIDRHNQVCAIEGRPDDQLPLWFPLQLRHSAGTEAREGHERGIEATQARLGHQEVTTSQIYATRSARLARDVARRFG